MNLPLDIPPPETPPIVVEKAEIPVHEHDAYATHEHLESIRQGNQAVNDAIQARIEALETRVNDLTQQATLAPTQPVESATTGTDDIIEVVPEVVEPPKEEEKEETRKRRKHGFNR